jgi:hypothetical protein
VSTRRETVARARELRSLCSAAVGARRCADPSAASVVLHGNRGTFRGLGVMLHGAMGQAGSGDPEGKAHDHGDDCNGVDAGCAQAVFGVGGVGATAVDGGEVSWEGCAGVERRAAVGCTRGADALLDPVHDSGGHGHVETGSRGSGFGGGGGGANTRVVAAGVDRVEMHVRDG